MAVAAVVAAGLGAWWWTRDGDDDPLAGRPWVTDLKAGVSYQVPEGWQRDRKDLVNAFTSTIRTKDDGEGDDAPYGMVLTGWGGAVAESGLRERAESTARSNAGFFYPDGSSEPTESEATTVDGRAAHTVVLAVKDGEGGAAHLRLTLVRADAGRSVFLLGVAKPGEGAEQEAADAVLGSATLL
ncbi:hypothetical protein RB200_37735 [Streptomyces sp. PmtG]